jgi:hypothetical protein
MSRLDSSGTVREANKNLSNPMIHTQVGSSIGLEVDRVRRSKKSTMDKGVTRVFSRRAL